MKTFQNWKGLFFSFLSFSPVLAVGIAVSTFISVSAEIAFPWFLKTGLDAALGEEKNWSLMSAALAMLATIFVIVLGHGCALFMEGRLFAAASARLRQQIYQQLQRIPFSFLGQERLGTLSYRATSDVAAFEAGLSELFSDFSFDALVALGVISAMAFTHGGLTFLVVFILGIASFISHVIGDRLPVYKRASQMLAARMAGHLAETLGAARTIRAFCAEEKGIQKLDVLNEKIRTTETAASVRRAIVLPLWHLAEALAIIVVLGFGGTLVASHTMSIGTLVAFIAYLELLAGPVNRFGDYVYRFQSCRGLAERIVETINLPCENEQHGAILKKPGIITLDNVSFAYADAPRLILSNISFTLREGSVTALLGKNGAGKSTLFDLLLRFYQPSSGRILASGTDIQDWNVKHWRGQIGLMAQETILLRGTIAENVALGHDNASEAEIENALHQAGADVLLKRLPQGIHTYVGERGATLSGGERQLIGLARLFLHNPRIVLLDEPTSQLDGETLRQVLTGLEKLIKGRTTLLITHQAELLHLAQDRILIDAGHVIAAGSHSELLTDSSLYKSLFSLSDSKEKVA